MQYVYIPYIVVFVCWSIFPVLHVYTIIFINL